MTDNLSFINWGFKPTTTTKPEDKDYWLIIGFHIVEDPACLTYWIYSKEDYPIIDDASLSEILEDFYGCEVEVDGSDAGGRFLRQEWARYRKASYRQRPGVHLHAVRRRVEAPRYTVAGGWLATAGGGASHTPAPPTPLA